MDDIMKDLDVSFQSNLELLFFFGGEVVLRKLSVLTILHLYINCSSKYVSDSDSDC